MKRGQISPSIWISIVVSVLIIISITGVLILFHRGPTPKPHTCIEKDFIVMCGREDCVRLSRYTSPEIFREDILQKLNPCEDSWSFLPEYQADVVKTDNQNVDLGICDLDKNNCKNAKYNTITGEFSYDKIQVPDTNSSNNENGSSEEIPKTEITPSTSDLGCCYYGCVGGNTHTYAVDSLLWKKEECEQNFQGGRWFVPSGDKGICPTYVDNGITYPKRDLNPSISCSIKSNDVNN